MKTKRFTSMAMVMVFSITLLMGSVVNAEELSAEKINLMKAAGEILPGTTTGQQVTEESVKIKSAEATEIALKFLENSSNYNTGSTNFFQTYGSFGKPAWSIDFNYKQSPGGNANVVVNADTGEVMGFNVWYYNNGRQNYIAAYTRAEAAKFAEAFLKEKIGIDPSQFELQPEDPYANTYKTGGVKEMVGYYYNYIRKINGILVPGDTISVNVDGTTGVVTSFNRNPSSLDMEKLPSTKGIMTAEQAMEKYKSVLGMSLQYMTIYGDYTYGTSKPKVMLAYVPSNYIDNMDSTSGTGIAYDGTETVLENNALSQLYNNPVPMKAGAVLPAGVKTHEEAAALAEKYKKLAEGILGVSFETDNTQQNMKNYYEQNDMWSYNWYKNSAESNYSFYISISKTTGSITNLSLSKYSYSYEKEMSMSGSSYTVKDNTKWIDGKAKALETVKQVLPDYYGFFMDQNVKEPVTSEEVKKTQREYYYSYTRVVNGIVFNNNNIGIGVDRETGAVTNLYFNWSDFDFPSPDALVAKDTATDKYVAGIEARLSYFQKRTYDTLTYMEKVDPVARLVYNFARKGYAYAGGMFVNAVTGELIDYNGKAIVSVNGTGTGNQTIPESWAKRSIELLAAQGIIREPSTAADTGLTKAEAVKMLSLAAGQIYYYYDYATPAVATFTDVPSDNAYFIYVENAVRQKIIEGDGKVFDGGHKITKDEFVKMLVNMDGYSELARYPEIFKLDGMTTSDSANTGYVAIAKALGLLPVKDGSTYDGTTVVTFGEAADSLYKALKYIR